MFFQIAPGLVHVVNDNILLDLLSMSVQPCLDLATLAKSLELVEGLRIVEIH